MLLRPLSVPLEADPVLPPRVLAGTLPVAGLGGGLEVVLFETVDGELGRITFEALESLRISGGELLPWPGDESAPGAWVFVLEGSDWLRERQDYELQHYGSSMRAHHQHFVFQFHDEYVEAIAAGIRLDVADPAAPLAEPTAGWLQASAQA